MDPIEIKYKIKELLVNEITDEWYHDLDNLYRESILTFTGFEIGDIFHDGTSRLQLVFSIKQGVSLNFYHNRVEIWEYYNDQCHTRHTYNYKEDYDDPDQLIRMLNRRLLEFVTTEVTTEPESKIHLRM